MCTTRQLCTAAEGAMKRAAGITSTGRLAGIGLQAALGSGEPASPLLEHVITDHAAQVASQHRFVLRLLPEAEAMRVIAQGLRAQGEDAKGESFTSLLMESMNEVLPLAVGPAFAQRLQLAKAHAAA